MGGTVQIFGNNLNKSKFYSEEIMSRLKSGNSCCHLVQNLLSSGLLSKNLKIKTYKTIILPVVLCGCETWLLTLRMECMRVYETKVSILDIIIFTFCM